MRNFSKTFGLMGKITVLVIICCCCLPVQGKYGGGTGEPNDPYLIYDANHMQAIGADANDWDKCFKLMADIDLSGFTGTSFNIIGYFVDWDDNQPFNGVFDGNDHTIYNFTYDYNGANHVGLFGFVFRGEIKDMGLIDPVVDAGTGEYVGSLVGELRFGTIIGCYVEGGSVSGHRSIGGLWGKSWMSTITNCYSTGSVAGNYYVGGMVGFNMFMVSTSFWDIETSGQTTSYGGTGLPTAEMQMQITFTDSGWDFTTPVWTIDEGVDYPRLWWELVPLLHAEPEVTLGTSNRILWEPVVGDVEYYAECAEDANFNSIVYNSGWITETSYKFTGLELGQRYWYSVKARNAEGTETNWSNVESSLQGTLADAVEMMLEPESLKNKNMKSALLNKIDEVLEMIEEGNYTDALSKLEHDILAKMNGCGETGEPDRNDWIITCEEQSEICPLVMETIEYVRGLMEE